MRHTVIPASYVLLKKGNKILLQRRFHTGYEDGKWSLPAGHVEEGETYTQCVIREIKEEIGVELSEKDLQVTHVLQRDGREASGEHRYRMDIFFLTEKWQGEPKIMEPNKCDGLEWFDMDELPDNVIPYIRHVIEKVQESIFYSEYGWESKEK